MTRRRRDNTYHTKYMRSILSFLTPNCLTPSHLFLLVTSNLSTGKGEQIVLAIFIAVVYLRLYGKIRRRTLNCLMEEKRI
jgi:hypothetical protein